MEPAEIVAGMQSGQPAAAESLYAVLSESPQRYMLARLGPLDNEDRVHELYLIVSRAIMEHRIAVPAALYGFIWTVARCQAALAISQIIRERSTPLSILTPEASPDAEASLLADERAQRLRRLMGGLQPRSREILDRFYIREQSKETIIQEMGLSDNAFRLVKSRALGMLRERAQLHQTPF